MLKFVDYIRKMQVLHAQGFSINAQQARSTTLLARVLSNEIFGGLGWGTGGSPGQAVRVEIIDNTIHGGGLSDVVTIGGGFSQSLIDDNRLVDTPGRICVGMGWHNYFRFNEIHQAFRSTWENAEEVYLVHGGVRSKTISFPTGASSDTLVDKRQDWNPCCSD